MFSVVLNAIYIILVAHHVSRDVDGIERIGPDIVGQRNISVPQFGGLDDQVVGFNKVFGVFRGVVITADLFPCFSIFHDSELSKLGVFGHFVIDGHQICTHPQIRVGGHIFHLLSLIVDLSTVV